MTGGRLRIGLALALALIAAAVVSPSPLAASPATVSSAASLGLVEKLDISEVMGHARYLSGLGSRFTGYPGYFKAVEYVVGTLEELGIDVTLHSFPVAVPRDRGAKLIIGDRVFEAHHLYPNLVALGAAGKLEGELVYLGSATARDLENVDLSGKIAVVEADCGNRWIDAIAKGARAVVFLGPIRDRLEAMAKLSLAPLDVPRLYVGEEHADAVRRAAAMGLAARVEGDYSWERVTAYNVLAVIRGAGEPEKVLILAAHLDSGSIVPALAPGAEEAVNVGFLLHLAKLLKESRPRYTVWLLFLSGHWQGLAGARWFVEDFLFNESRGVGRDYFPYMVFNFEIASGAPQLVVYPGGFFYGHRHQGAMELYRTLLNSLRGWLKEFYRKYPDDHSKIISRAFMYNPATDIAIIESFLPGYAVGVPLSLYLDTEPFQLAMVPAVTFLSFKDPRIRLFTPEDKFELIDWQNVVPQLRFTLFVVEKALSDISAVYAGSWDSIRPTRRAADPNLGGFGFMTVKVEVVEYDPTVPAMYRPVPNALVVVHKIDWSYNFVGSLGITIFDPPFGKIIEMADESGAATVVGVPPVEANIGNIAVYAYGVVDGRLTYVPDYGPYGLRRFLPYSSSVTMATVYRAVVFKAAGLLLPRIGIPDQPWQLTLLNNYWKPSYPVPFTRYTAPYPLTVSVFYPNLATPDSYGYEVDHLNNLAIVFAPPHSRIGVVIGFGGEQRRAVMLLNYSAGEVRGYQLGGAGTLLAIVNPEETYARELLAVARDRYEKARRGGVVDPSVEELMALAEGYLEKGVPWAAWSLALKLYERTFGMSLDFAAATLVTMILTIPFAIVAEKLVGGKGGIMRILTMVAVAAAVYVLFAVLHPGFTVVYSANILALGVIAAALATPAAFFLLLNLSRALGYVKAARVGVHELKREAFDMLVSAMAAGIENMKRRPLRTSLTLSTIILVVLSLVSLTSIVPIYRVRASEYESLSAFDGIVIRSPSGEPIDPRVVEVVKAIVGDRGSVSVRYWLYPPLILTIGTEREETWGNRFIVTSKDGRVATFAVAVGVAAGELEMSMRDLGLTPEFFEKVPVACLLPKSAASYLGVDVGDVVDFLGFKLLVTGFFDDAAAERLVRDVPDRAGELVYGIKPFDVAEMWQRQTGGPAAYIPFRVPWSSILVVNAEFVEKLPGAFVSSIAIRLRSASGEELASLASELNRIFDKLEVYYSSKGRGYLLSSRYVYEFFGFGFVIIPVVIASLSLMIAILGAVFERMREASIYSALGLAPAHVGGMFLAEILAYAIIGVVLGYTAGVVAARLANFAAATGGVVGMNYSSSSVLTSLGIVAALMLAVSAYPLASVSKTVTPSLERKWRIPTRPRGDTWEIPLPFTFREREMLAGLVAYLCEYLENRRERVGTFTVLDYRPFAEPERAGVRARVWLAPYEQNIIQEVAVSFSKSKTEARYLTTLTAQRVSGPYDLWRKGCETFAREIREQLLTWRLISGDERRKYIALGRSMVGGYE